jgi:hypothetical protein
LTTARFSTGICPGTGLLGLPGSAGPLGAGLEAQEANTSAAATTKAIILTIILLYSCTMPQFEKLFNRAASKLQFWNSNLKFNGKKRTFDRFFQKMSISPFVRSIRTLDRTP